MAGTKEGGLRAYETMIKKYGKDFFAINGAVGGKAKVPKGFAMMDKDKLRKLAAKGGRTGTK